VPGQAILVQRRACRLSDRRSRPGRYRVDGYKIVAGEQIFMGSLDLSRDGDRLTGSNTDRAGIVHPWIFTLKGRHMSGRALSSVNGPVFRLVEVDKQ
jgi:hypothetical protein